MHKGQGQKTAPLDTLFYLPCCYPASQSPHKACIDRLKWHMPVAGSLLPSTVQLTRIPSSAPRQSAHTRRRFSFLFFLLTATHLIEWDVTSGSPHLEGEQSTAYWEPAGEKVQSRDDRRRRRAQRNICIRIPSSDMISTTKAARNKKK